MIDVTNSTTPPAQTLELVVSQSGLEVAKAPALVAEFRPHYNNLSEWRKHAAMIVISDVSQVQEMELARRLRLMIKAGRLQVEAKRRDLKTDVLTLGRAIDACYNTFEAEAKALEADLLAQEQFALRKEVERKAKLKIAREAVLLPYGVNTTFFDLAGMTEEAFVELHTNTRLGHEARIEAERQAEIRRAAAVVEAAAAAERTRLENIRLKEEADAKAAAERAAAAKAAKEKAAAQLKERQRLQALAEVERQKAEAARAEAEAARIEKEKAEAELAAVRKAQEQLAPPSWLRS